MSTTTTTTTESEIELSTFHPITQEPLQLLESQVRPQPNDDEPPESAYSTTAIPDGGYGWIVVLCCSMTVFWSNGIINCWGVLQAALLDSTLKEVPTSTVAWVGSLGLAGSAGFGILAVRCIRILGSRTTSLVGVVIMGMSLVASAECVDNVPGLFGTAGLMAAVGMCMVYTVSNTLPVQYFSGHLGLANGLVKLGGGIGGCVLAIAMEAMYRRVGIAWTFRIQGLLTIGVGFPAAWFQKDRVPLRNVPFVDWAMFKSMPFVAVFVAASIGTFALFVPPYFLPLFATSIGLSSSTGAGLVSAFNACNAIGRFIAGPLCDKIGPVNMFLITMLVNAVSMLAIWPVSNSLGPLVLFATLNGVANGSFFTTVPTVVTGIFGPGRATIGISMAVTGWAGGYLVGAPIAGYLLQAGGGKQDGTAGKQGVDVYRPTIFYAGGVAMASFLFVVLAKWKLDKKFTKRV
ncbi:major facilitator superfamily domain-containing protein [Lophiotrema nucula]|uniref:Major facilitator superfamily domain-containing protein n=1 Tax=Lophiotrema nucula TaxID=690887 RepID=A0A6A5ZCC0_9PLEO|nr:major facilitator superfamily domain-containing protein [Lophiotrema nucula]